MTKKNIFFTILAISISTLITLLILEFFFRVDFYLKTINFYNNCPKNCKFNVFNKSPFIWNEITGGDFPQNENFIKATFKKKKFVRCRYLSTNSQGQFSKLENRSSSYLQKILILGDSMTTYTHDHNTWPYLLQQKLMKEYNNEFYIKNLARGGIGILQMHDIAEKELKLNSYDVILFVYISDDLDRARSWKKFSKVNDQQGVIKRFYNKNFELENYRYTKNLVDNKLNVKVCDQLANDFKTKNNFYIKNEKLFKEISKNDLKLKYKLNDSKTILKKIFFSNHIYTVNIIKNNNLNDLIFSKQISRHKIRDSFYQEPKLIKSIKKLQQNTNTKIFYIHIPIYNEIIKKTYDQNEKFVKLKNELVEMTMSSNVFHVNLLESIEIGPNEAKKIPVNRLDQHPSLFGLNFYAENIFSILKKKENY